MQTTPYPALSVSFVRSILDYDPETGVFTWKHRADRAKNWNTRNAGKIAGHLTRYGYVRIQIEKGVHYAAHVLAWLYVHGEWLPNKIDHRHGVRDDNRITELRRMTLSDNGCNKAMQRNNQSGHPGVHFETQSGKWEAVVSKNGKRVWRRKFNTLKEAATARAQAVREIHGEFVPVEPKRARYFHHRDAP